MLGSFLVKICKNLEFLSFFIIFLSFFYLFFIISLSFFYHFRDFSNFSKNAGFIFGENLQKPRVFVISLSFFYHFFIISYHFSNFEKFLGKNAQQWEILKS